jgi:hypothetical protein
MVTFWNFVYIIEYGNITIYSIDIIITNNEKLKVYLSEI